MSMSNTLARVSDQENIYRSVSSTNWVDDEMRPSTSTFKNAIGVSVDVEHNRSTKDCIDFLATRFPDQVAVIRLATKFCRSVSLEVEYVPETGNPHHAHIVNEDGTFNISKGKRKLLIEGGYLVLKPA